MASDAEISAQYLVEDLHKLEEEQLVDYIRETVVRLDTLADRLESYVSIRNREEQG